MLDAEDQKRPCVSSESREEGRQRGRQEGAITMKHHLAIPVEMGVYREGRVQGLGRILEWVCLR